MKQNTEGVDNLTNIKLLEDKRDYINNISPSFCSAKWLQTTLYLQNGYNHSCHHPSPHKIPVEEVEANPSALHNSKFKKQQRAKMLKGERPTECDYCWNIEDLGKGYFSDRHTKTADYWAWHRVDEVANSDPEEDVYPSYLEISFSNACNFACAYCTPEASSKWMKDIKKNGPYPVEFGSHNLEGLRDLGKIPYRTDEYNPYVNAFNKWFPEALPYLKVFRITGGEPTMSKDFWKTLDFIIENPREDLEISINTNLGVPPELIDKLISYAKKLDSSCKECVIFTSCEAYGKQAEYIRDGLDYDYWYSNVEKILEQTDCKVVTMTTINALSLPSFTRWLEHMMELRIKYDILNHANRTTISFNYLRFPPHLQVTILPDSIRSKYADDIEKYVMQWHRDVTPLENAKFYLEEIDQVKRFCDYMRKGASSGPKYRENFMQFIQHYDIRRNKDFISTFPEYETIYEQWQEEYKDKIQSDFKDIIRINLVEV